MNALGIDVGGSGFRIGVFNVATGALVGELERHAHGESTEPEIVLSAVRSALEAINWHGPIGMGFPGAVEDGRPITAPNLGEAWVGCDIGASLQHYHDGRFALINDADAVAVAERQYGAGHGKAARVLTLTVGTGLGTTLHEDGTLVPWVDRPQGPPTFPEREEIKTVLARIETSWLGERREQLAAVEAT